MITKYLRRILSSLVVTSAWYSESFSMDDREFQRALEMSRQAYQDQLALENDLMQIALQESIQQELKRQDDKKKEVDANLLKQNADPFFLIRPFQDRVNSITGGKQSFKQSHDDTLFYVLDNQLNHSYGYGNHALFRENSSSDKNCCFLFSIIGDNEDLLTKVLGDRNQAREILKNPELANMYDEDVVENKLKRRDFTLVREKFMKDILQAMKEDRKFYLENEQEQSFREFVSRIIRTFNSDKSTIVADPNNADGYTIIVVSNRADRSTTASDPKSIVERSAFIPVEYATLFSILYDTPVVPLNKENISNPVLMNPLVRDKGFGMELMPYFSKEEWKRAIFIYHHGVHYQKLHVLD